MKPIQQEKDEEPFAKIKHLTTNQKTEQKQLELAHWMDLRPFTGTARTAPHERPSPSQPFALPDPGPALPMSTTAGECSCRKSHGALLPSDGVGD